MKKPFVMSLWTISVVLLIMTSTNVFVGCSVQPVEPNYDMENDLSTKVKNSPTLMYDTITPTLVEETKTPSKTNKEAASATSTALPTSMLVLPIVVPTTVVEVESMELIPNEIGAVGTSPTHIVPTEIAPTVGPMNVELNDRLAVDQSENESVTTPFGRDLIALTLSLKKQEGALSGSHYNKTKYEIGAEEYFYVVDFSGTAMKKIKATLGFISDNAHWFFEDGVNFDGDDLTESAKFFEEKIIPSVIGSFGTIWPHNSTDNLDSEHPRISILHANMSGVLGYFNSSDEYSKEINEFSNERKMIYINSPMLEPGEGEYLRVLAHELQHVVHWNHNKFQDTWLNEGLSQAAEMKLGFLPNHINAFRSYPLSSLVHWPITGDSVSANYGAAFLFTWYLENRFFQDGKFLDLINRESVGIDAINEQLSFMGKDETFESIFEEWTITNFVPKASKESEFYREVNLNLEPTDSFRPGETLNLYQPQYSARYIDINKESDELRVKFKGTEEVPIISSAPQVGDHCWWSNLGNSISSTLTRSIDLSDVLQAHMQIRFWHDVEEYWDYLYVEISEDGGTTWDMLYGNHMTDENPFGLGFGPGYTGSSVNWLNDEFDLSAYAGSQILLRFHYVTDGNFYGEGFCLDQLVIPEIDLYDDGSDENGWISNGFILTDNLTAQDYFIYIIQNKNEATSIRKVDVMSGGYVEFNVSGLLDSDRTTMVVGSLSPNSIQQASYLLTGTRN